MASTPSGGLPPSPAQAGHAASAQERGSRDLWLCSWIVSGCRSRRGSPGPGLPPRRETAVKALGLAYQPRARAAKGCTPVEGRRPGIDEAAVFDETSAEAVPGGLAAKRRAERPARLARGRDRGRQRLRRMLGGRSITPPSGGAARRSFRSKLRQDRAASRSQSKALGATRARPTGTGRDKAEAGGSPSSEASPVWRIRVAIQESGNPWGARIGSRLQKSERRIFLASFARACVTGQPGVLVRRAEPRDSLKRPAIL